MKISNSTISLPNMRFYAYHGVMPHETRVGNEYFVSLVIQFDATSAMQSDDLTDTINYAEIYAIVQVEMAIPSKLLEHVAGRILTALFCRFAGVTQATISIEKSVPPIAGYDGAPISFTATASLDD